MGPSPTRDRVVAAVPKLRRGLAGLAMAPLAGPLRASCHVECVARAVAASNRRSNTGVVANQEFCRRRAARGGFVPSDPSRSLFTGYPYSS